MWLWIFNHQKTFTKYIEFWLWIFLENLFNHACLWTDRELGNRCDRFWGGKITFTHLKEAYNCGNASCYWQWQCFQLLPKFSCSNFCHPDFTWNQFWRLDLLWMKLFAHFQGNQYFQIQNSKPLNIMAKWTIVGDYEITQK